MNPPAARSARITSPRLSAISSMATAPVLRDLAAAAAQAGLAELDITSVGGVDAAARVRAGEGFDLVFLAAAALNGLAADGFVEAVTSLLVSQVAVAVPSTAEESATAAGDADGPAFEDADGLRTALLAADRIGFSTGPSGTALVGMIDQWGLTAQLGPRLVQAMPGVPVATMLAAGEVQLGLQQASELVGKPGIRIVGVLPAECAIVTVFAGAVGRAAADKGAAAALLSFLRSDVAAAIAHEHRFQSAASSSGG